MKEPFQRSIKSRKKCAMIVSFPPSFSMSTLKNIGWTKHWTRTEYEDVKINKICRGCCAPGRKRKEPGVSNWEYTKWKLWVIYKYFFKRGKNLQNFIQAKNCIYLGHLFTENRKTTGEMKKKIEIVRNILRKENFSKHEE